MLGIIGPAAYAEAYSCLWDRPDAYSDQLRTFGRGAFESLLARPDARLWIGEVGGAAVGFLSMIVGPVGLRYPESTLLGQPSAWAWAAGYSTQRLTGGGHGPVSPLARRDGIGHGGTARLRDGASEKSVGAGSKGPSKLIYRKWLS